MKVLITAYACRPAAGSEAGYGWNYPTGLAERGHEVHAIVPTRFRDDVVAGLAEGPRSGVTFHFLTERDSFLRLGWTVGSVLRYVLWQLEAAELARRLDVRHDFDVLHHVSYGTLLGGCFLYRVGKPFVFGPVGGGQTAPDAFLGYFGAGRRAEALRSLVIRRLWRLDFPAIRAAREAAVVLVANRDTADLARRMGAGAVRHMSDVYLPDNVLPRRPPTHRPRSELRLLWVGRYLPRKGHRLTVEALDTVPAETPVTLEMVGDGPVEAEFRTWLDRTRRRHPVNLRGRLPWAKVFDEYRQADAFIFTSLRDTTGIQILEAMSQGLPVVTLDHQGAAELVPDDAGIRVPVTTPDATRRGLADAIVTLARDPERRRRMGEAAWGHAARHTLSRQLDEIEDIYRSVTSVVAPDAVRRY